MLESISPESAQGSITMVYDSTYEAGTKITVTDEDGDELISQVIDDTMSAVTLSSAGMKSGSTYTVTTGEDSEEITMDTVSYSNTELTGMGGGFGVGKMGNMGDGEKMQGKPGGMGGRGNRGGNGQMPQMEGNTDGGQTPQMDGNTDGGQMPQMDGNMNGKMMQKDSEWDMDNASTVKTWYTPTNTDFIWVGVGAATLLIAIGLAAVFKRRKRFI